MRTGGLHTPSVPLSGKAKLWEGPSPSLWLCLCGFEVRTEPVSVSARAKESVTLMWALQHCCCVVFPQPEQNPYSTLTNAVGLFSVTVSPARFWKFRVLR